MTREHLKIGFISVDSPEDKKTSSGTLYTIASNFKSIGDLEWIHLSKSKIYNYLEIFLKVLAKSLGRNICFSHTKIGSRLLKKSLNHIDFAKYDVIVAYWCGSVLGGINFKKTPVIYLSDTTFPAMINYYHPFSHLWKWNINQGLQLERESLSNVSSIILSSDWSANSAIKDLDQDSQKINVIEFGANLSEKDIDHFRQHNISIEQELTFLFLGVEWERKGGDIAVEAIKWLNDNGIKCSLHIVGIKNLKESVKKLPYVENIGFLNKNDPTQYQKFAEEISKCCALILPTKAECSAIAFAEASAYGLPTFTYETGGIPNYIQNNLNGIMLPISANGMDFGIKIKECLDNHLFSQMSQFAREVYLQKLNWNVWTAKVKGIVNNLVN